MNTTIPALADDLDRHKRDRVFRRQEGHEHFGFDLEAVRFEGQTGPGIQMNKPETALRVGEVPACAP